MADNRMRGIIPVTSDIQQQGRVERGGAGQLIDDGMSGALGTFATEFDQVAKKTGQWADNAAQREAAQMGELDGLDPEFRPTRSMTIRGEAYDKAGLQVMQSKLKQGIAADFEGLADKAGNDPAQLAKLIDAKKAGWLGKVEPEILSELTLFVGGLEKTAMRGAVRAQKAAATQERMIAAHGELQTELRVIQRMAYQSGLDPETQAQLGEKQGAVMRLLSRRGPDGRPLFSAETRIRESERLKSEVAEAQILGAFTRLPDIESQRRAIDDLRVQYGKGEGPAAAFTRDQFQRTEGELLREYSRRKTDQRAQFAGVATQVRATIQNAQSGFVPRMDDLAAIETRVRETRDPELIQQFADATMIADHMRRAAQLAPAELSQVNSALREQLREQGTGTSTRAAKLLEHSEALERNQAQALAKDPIGWADRVGVRKAQPLMLEDDKGQFSPPALAATLRQRMADAEAIAARFDRTPQYIRPEDAERLSAVLAKGGPAATDVYAAIAAGAGPKAGVVMGELVKSGTGPAVARVGQLFLDHGATATVRDATDGFALLNMDGRKKIDLPEKDVRSSLARVMGDAVDASDPEAAAALKLAAALHEKRASKEKKSAFDSAIFDQSLREAVGQQTIGGVTYGGVVSQAWWSPKPIVLPPFLKQSAWQQAVGAVTPEDLDAAGLGRPIGTGGRAVTWGRVTNAGTLVRVGDGQFLVSLGNPDARGQEQWVMRDGGRPFVLDFRALRPHLQKRRPDLFAPEPR